MKTFDEIIKQEPIFLNIFQNKDNVLEEFAPDCWGMGEIEKKRKFIEDNKNINILFASYGCDNYEGGAWVLFEQGGNLYEVIGGHCSCYGLEGQWEPERVSLKELEHRLLNGAFGEDDWSGNNFKQELCKFLDVEFIKKEEMEEI